MREYAAHCEARRQVEKEAWHRTARIAGEIRAIAVGFSKGQKTVNLEQFIPEHYRD